MAISNRFLNTAVLLLAFIYPGSAGAQDTTLRPLAEYLQLPDNRKEQAYPFVRCTGLFRGIFRYGGATFSDEVTASTQEGNEAMMLVAFRYRLSKGSGQAPEKLVAQMGKEIEAIEVLYANRMQSNYNRTGEA